MKGYYDFELNLEEMLEGNGLVDEHFRLKDLQSRKLYLNGEISMMNVEDTIKHIIRYNTEDKGKAYEGRTPIILYISSNGGEVYAGFELIDVILNSMTPVYTVNMGYQFSMGFLIGLAGHKRFATQNAKYLWHDGISGVFNSSAKVRDEIEFQNRNEAKIRQYVLDRTRITPELYDAKTRIEWYMFSEEARDLGVTDFVIGEDCSLDAII